MAEFFGTPADALILGENLDTETTYNDSPEQVLLGEDITTSVSQDFAVEGVDLADSVEYFEGERVTDILEIGDQLDLGLTSGASEITLFSENLATRTVYNDLPDSVVLGDTPLYTSSDEGVASDGLLLGEDITTQISQTFSVETVVVGDSTLFAISLDENLGDGIVLTDSPGTLVGEVENISDTSSMGEQLSLVFNASPSTQDAALFGENFNTSTTYHDSPEEVVLGDSVSYETAGEAATVDGVVFGENITNRVTAYEDLDLVLLGDSAVYSTAEESSVVDIAVLGENLDLVLGYLREDDTAVFGDAASSRDLEEAGISDSVVFQEDFTVSVINPQDTLESIRLGDTSVFSEADASGYVSAGLVTGESLDLTLKYSFAGDAVYLGEESYSRADFDSTLVESVNLSDTLGSLLHFISGISDGVSLEDDNQGLTEGEEVVSDAVLLSESLEIVLGYLAQEGVAFGDAVPASLGLLELDTARFGDALDPDIGHKVGVTDLVRLQDAVFRGDLAQLTDLAVFADSLLGLSPGEKSVSDGFTLADQVTSVYTPFGGFADVISFNAHILRSMSFTVDL